MALDLNKIYQDWTQFSQDYATQWNSRFRVDPASGQTLERMLTDGTDYAWRNYQPGLYGDQPPPKSVLDSLDLRSFASQRGFNLLTGTPNPQGYGGDLVDAWHHTKEWPSFVAQFSSLGPGKDTQAADLAMAKYLFGEGSFVGKDDPNNPFKQDIWVSTNPKDAEGIKAFPFQTTYGGTLLGETPLGKIALGAGGLALGALAGGFDPSSLFTSGSAALNAGEGWTAADFAAANAPGFGAAPTAIGGNTPLYGLSGTAGGAGDAFLPGALWPSGGPAVGAGGALDMGIGGGGIALGGPFDAVAAGAEIPWAANLRTLESNFGPVDYSLANGGVPGASGLGFQGGVAPSGLQAVNAAGQELSGGLAGAVGGPAAGAFGPALGGLTSTPSWWQQFLGNYGLPGGVGSGASTGTGDAIVDPTGGAQGSSPGGINNPFGLSDATMRLLGAGLGAVAGSQTQPNIQSNLPPWLEQLLFSQSQLTPDELSAMNLIRGQTGQTSANYGGALTQQGKTIAGQYLDPRTNPAVQGQLQALTDQFTSNVLPGAVGGFYRNNQAGPMGDASAFANPFGSPTGGPNSILSMLSEQLGRGYGQSVSQGYQQERTNQERATALGLGNNPATNLFALGTASRQPLLNFTQAAYKNPLFTTSPLAGAIAGGLGGYSAANNILNPQPTINFGNLNTLFGNSGLFGTSGLYGR